MALGPFGAADKLKEGGRPATIVLLMRHGETAWNREGRVMGRQPVDLDQAGREQVERAVPLARLLAPEVIISSPLARARQSAQIIADGTGVREVFADPRLEEVRYGTWENKTYHQLIQDPHYVGYRRAPLESRTPGGETIAEVQARGVAAVETAIAAYRGRRVLLVSHGDIIRTILCHYLKLELKHFHRVRVDNASFFGLEINHDFAEVKFMNLLPDPERAFKLPFKRD
jgi:broad specificity phosphatase PhoE